MSRKKYYWGFFMYPALAALMFFALYFGVTNLWQMKDASDNRKTAVAAVEAAKAEHLQGLRSWGTTEVVIPAGPKGLISYYWVKSGASHLYSLDEYKSLVRPLSKGAEVSAPVEGDHFLVPWMSGK